MEFPRVSIITPVYNCAGYVRETIESVLGQDYPNLEYILLDDGSSDESWEIIREYSEKARVYSHTNMGESKTVNKGFSLATGEYVGLVNADDPLLPGCLRATAGALRDNPQVQVTYPDWDMIDPHGGVISTIRTKEYSYAWMLSHHDCLPGPGALYRMTAARQVGGWDESLDYVADFDFWLRVGLIGPFLRVPERLATFRSHPAQKTSGQKGAVMAREHVEIIRKLYRTPGLPEEIRRMRAVAMSSAYYIGGTVAGDNLELKKYFYLRAWLLAPGFYRRPEEKERADQMRFWLRTHTRNSLVESLQKGEQLAGRLARRVINR